MAEKSEVSSKKLVAGILAILLGWTGAHKFYLGMTTTGVIQLVVSLCTLGAGGIVGIIEGIIYLTKSDEDFERLYMGPEKKQWF
jgi:TM2 domain-containing membrane protein YozV